MPTDEERREVASKLRSIDPEDFASSYSEEFEKIENILGIRGDYSRFIWHVVADLIDPEPERMCSMVQDARYSESYMGPMLRCSSCDAALPEQFVGPYHYCPNCGAKAVE